MNDSLFQKLCDQYLNGELAPDTHRVEASRIDVFDEEDLTQFEILDSVDFSKGQDALREGRFARLILNGGMATRFGGRVKGICEVYDGKSFLELKLEHMKRLEGLLQVPEIPVALMHSPATHEATMEMLEAHNYFGRKKLTAFVQPDFPRITPEGEPFKHDDIKKTRAPRGHGDFLESLITGGILETWKAQGVTLMDFSNIDNLGATVNPHLLGAMLSSARPMGVELARKNPGDKGGAACRRDGVAGVLEGIYFDDVFDQDSLPWFNTNNLFFSLEGLEQLHHDTSYEMPWNVVGKKVDGSPVIQFEHIAIDALFGFNRKPDDNQVLFFAVPREGPGGRFFPVKSPEDLENLREDLRKRLDSDVL